MKEERCVALSPHAKSSCSLFFKALTIALSELDVAKMYELSGKC